MFNKKYQILINKIEIFFKSIILVDFNSTNIVNFEML